MFRPTLLTAAFGNAFAFKLWAMKDSQHIGGKNSQLLEIDMDTQAERVVNEELTADIDFLRGSVVCGNTWYGIGSALTMSGNLIARVDLTTGELTKTHVGGMWYQLKCATEAETLYGVVATGSPPQFGLAKLTLGDEVQTDIIGQFPDVLWAGWVSTFTFSGNELQANFAKKGKLDSSAKGGEMFRMDVTTGEITMHKEFSKGLVGSGTVPYYIKHTEGAMTTTGIFSAEEGRNELSLCHVDYKGSKASVSKCRKLGEEWWNSGKPVMPCGTEGLHYFPSLGARTETYEPILSGDMDTGDFKEVHQLQGDYLSGTHYYYIGTHFCEQPTQLVV